jgi:hypothetical protein
VKAAALAPMRRVKGGGWLFSWSIVPMSEQLYVFVAAFRTRDHEWRFPIEELSRGHGIPLFHENRSG